MYLLALEWVTAPGAAFAACLYIANPYALFVAYERTAYGELLAGAWLPLLVLFALRRKRSMAALGLAVAALWLTNSPAAVEGSYLLALLAVAMWIAEKNPWPALRAAGGMLLGLGLAAFYIVPAAYEQRWVQIERAITPGMRVQDSFLFAHTADAFHDPGAAYGVMDICGRVRSGLYRCLGSLAQGERRLGESRSHNRATGNFPAAVAAQCDGLAICAALEVSAIPLALADGLERDCVRAGRHGPGPGTMGCRGRRIRYCVHDPWLRPVVRSTLRRRRRGGWANGGIPFRPGCRGNGRVHADRCR